MGGGSAKTDGKRWCCVSDATPTVAEAIKTLGVAIRHNIIVRKHHSMLPVIVCVTIVIALFCVGGWWQTYQELKNVRLKSTTIIVPSVIIATPTPEPVYSEYSGLTPEEKKELARLEKELGVSAQKSKPAPIPKPIRQSASDAVAASNAPLLNTPDIAIAGNRAKNPTVRARINMAISK